MIIFGEFFKKYLLKKEMIDVNKGLFSNVFVYWYWLKLLILVLNFVNS